MIPIDEKLKILQPILGTKRVNNLRKMHLFEDDRPNPIAIAREIGAMAAVLQGKVDAVVLTGGLAHSTEFTDRISEYIKFIGPVIVIPGEEELEALAAGALRVLREEEEALEY